MPSDEMAADRVHISWALLARFRKEGEAFLKQVITGDGTWSRHYDSHNKRPSLEYRRKGSPRPKKFETQASAGKVTLTAVGLTTLPFRRALGEKGQRLCVGGQA